jgi:hypothetical protein
VAGKLVVAADGLGYRKSIVFMVLMEAGVGSLDEMRNRAATCFFMPSHRLAGDDAATTLSLLDFPETDVTRSGA